MFDSLKATKVVCGLSRASTWFAVYQSEAVHTLVWLMQYVCLFCQFCQVCSAWCAVLKLMHT
jgi:hypothetical protein